jgi:hypothetical protein
MTITERNDFITHLTCILNDLPGDLHTMVNVNGPTGPALDLVMYERKSWPSGRAIVTKSDLPLCATVTITYDELGEAMTRGWGYPQHLIRKRWDIALAAQRADS